MADYTAKMHFPDYSHSIVNLLSSLAGHQAPAPELYPPLAVMNQFDLQERPVALLVIDGLGYDFLCRHPGSNLYSFLIDRLSSVFPTTTATAVTALALGVPAQQHGITGWFTYFKELGCVAAPLPFVPRGGGRDFSEQVKAQQLIEAPCLLPKVDRPTSLVNPSYIADSAYSQGLFADVDRRSHQGLSSLFEEIEAALHRSPNSLVWSYWTELDALSHQCGVASREVAEHFNRIDLAFGEFIDRMAGSGAAIIVTADHGLIDTTPEHTVHLEQHPLLKQALQLPLCGEPRAAFCYLRSGYEECFDDYVQQHLSDSFQLFRSDQLIEQGWFGCGPASNRLAERVGDRLLLPRDNWIIKDRLLPEKEFQLIGVHGGLSAEELYVPLLVAEC